MSQRPHQVSGTLPIQPGRKAAQPRRQRRPSRRLSHGRRPPAGPLPRTEMIRRQRCPPAHTQPSRRLAAKPDRTAMGVLRPALMPCSVAQAAVATVNPGERRSRSHIAR